MIADAAPYAEHHLSVRSGKTPRVTKHASPWRSVAAATLLTAAISAGTAAPAAAAPDTLPPYDGPGEFQNDQSPLTSRCWYRDAYIVHENTVDDLVRGADGNNYPVPIGRVELWYSSYCQTNWINVVLDDKSGDTTIQQYTHIPIETYNDDFEYQTTTYSDVQVDTASEAFSMMLYAPGDTPLWWNVDVYKNGYKIGADYGGCIDPYNKTKECF